MECCSILICLSQHLKILGKLVSLMHSCREVWYKVQSSLSGKLVCEANSISLPQIVGSVVRRVEALVLCLPLSFVFHVPTIKLNLVSVSHITKTLNCSVTYLRIMFFRC